MSLFIPTPRLARFDAMVGPYQKAVLDMVSKAKGRKQREAKPGAITSTDKIRLHIFNDLVGKGMLESRFDEKKGGITYLITERGERARKQATVTAAPPSGYRKVRRGRPALKQRRAA